LSSERERPKSAIEVEALSGLHMAVAFMNVRCYYEMKLDCYLLCVCVLGGRNGLGAGGLRKFAYTAYSFYFPLGAP